MSESPLSADDLHQLLDQFLKIRDDVICSGQNQRTDAERLAIRDQLLLPALWDFVAELEGGLWPLSLTARALHRMGHKVSDPKDITSVISRLDNTDHDRLTMLLGSEILQDLIGIPQAGHQRLGSPLADIAELTQGVSLLAFDLGQMAAPGGDAMLIANPVGRRRRSGNKNFKDAARHRFVIGVIYLAAVRGESAKALRETVASSLSTDAWDKWRQSVSKDEINTAKTDASKGIVRPGVTLENLSLWYRHAIGQALRLRIV